MSTPLDRFAAAAEEFCAWCAAPAAAELDEARVAIGHLARLNVLARDLSLPEEIDADLDGEGTDDATWQAVFKRAGALPFNYYSEVLDPLEIPPGDAGIGDLADDIADIHRDLTSGLSLYRGGHVAEAQWEWRHTFDTHWGRHATAAVHALHCWLAVNDEW